MEGGCTCQQVRYRLVGTPLIVPIGKQPPERPRRTTNRQPLLRAIFRGRSGSPKLEGLAPCAHSKKSNPVRNPRPIAVLGRRGSRLDSRDQARRLPDPRAPTRNDRVRLVTGNGYDFADRPSVPPEDKWRMS
jgi:hypothetical protein